MLVKKFSKTTQRWILTDAPLSMTSPCHTVGYSHEIFIAYNLNTLAKGRSK